MTEVCNNLNKSNPANFRLVFPLVPTETKIEASNALTLNIYSTVVPSVTLETLQQNWQGGVANFDGGGISYEPFFTNFVVDSGFVNWKVLFKWMMLIHNNKDHYGKPRSEYLVDTTLSITDNNNNVIIEIDFINMWCNMLGEITLSTRESEVNLECVANFMYDRYEVKNLG